MCQTYGQLAKASGPKSLVASLTYLTTILSRNRYSAMLIVPSGNKWNMVTKKYFYKTHHYLKLIIISKLIIIKIIKIGSCSHVLWDSVVI